MQCLQSVLNSQNLRQISADALYYHIKQACGLSSRTFLSILRGVCERRDKANIHIDIERLLPMMSLDAVMQLCADKHVDMAIRKDILAKLSMLPGFSCEAWKFNQLPQATYQAYKQKMAAWSAHLT